MFPPSSDMVRGGGVPIPGASCVGVPALRFNGATKQRNPNSILWITKGQSLRGDAQFFFSSFLSHFLVFQCSMQHWRTRNGTGDKATFFPSYIILDLAKGWSLALSSDQFAAFKDAHWKVGAGWQVRSPEVCPRQTFNGLPCIQTAMVYGNCHSRDFAPSLLLSSPAFQYATLKRWMASIYFP